MNLIKCENKHYYDGDKYDHCPYCSSKEDDSVTVGLAQTNLAEQEKESMNNKNNTDDNITVGPRTAETEVQRNGQSGQPSGESKSEKAGPINTATAWGQEEDDNVTVGYYSQVIGVEPVVGWLVCIKGEYRGESFRLKAGRNFIGRAGNMDIVLSADMSVSRMRHAAVIYEPHERQFIVTAGDARELCYLNGKVVITSDFMKPYDVLTLGNTELVFVPFCGDRFDWENGLRPEEEK